MPPRLLSIVESVLKSTKRLEEKVIPLKLGRAGEPRRRVVSCSVSSRSRGAGVEPVLVDLDPILEAGSEVERFRIVEGAAGEESVEVIAGMGAETGGREVLAGDVEEQDLLDLLYLVHQTTNGVDGKDGKDDEGG
jgi:hypothetical protein